MKNKNLEAENEVFKGIFRTPFAFLIGGPVGLIANTVYTIHKTNEEIERENAHKLYIESIFKKTDCINYIEQEKQEKEMDEIKEKNILLYLIDEFDGAQDISWLKDLHLNYSKKERGGFVSARNSNRAVFHYYEEDGTPQTFGGTYYPEKDFLVRYDNDKKNNRIIAKCVIRDNNIRATFCYKTDDDFIFTGMFTQL